VGVTRFWHPFADMGLVSAAGELVLDRGEGVYVFDEDGRRYLDATASLWYCNVGHGRTEIAEAVGAQLTRLGAYHTYADVATRPVLELSEWIADHYPVPGSVVYFGSGGGGEGVESAVKLALRYWSLVGQGNRTVVISRDRAYHGMNGIGTALTGPAVFREGLPPFAYDVEHVPWDSAEALRETIGRIGSDRVAAFICEPIVGAGGVLLPPEGYLDSVRSICRETGVLFIADEVVTGFGRVGSWFASERFALDPDITTFAKGVTSGYVPLGGFIASPTVAEPFWQPGGGVVFRHGYTYSGHTSAAAALANLAVIEGEGLVERARELELELANALAPLASHPLVSEIRAGLGVVAGVQLSPDAIAEDPALPERAARAARDAGVLTRAMVGGALQVSPPLVITRPELDDVAAGLAAGLDACALAEPATT
jgi:putrescine aminotransferase